MQAVQDVKIATSKKPAPPLPDYKRIITKSIKADKRKQKAELKAGKEVAQLEQ